MEKTFDELISITRKLQLTDNVNDFRKLEEQYSHLDNPLVTYGLFIGYHKFALRERVLKLLPRLRYYTLQENWMKYYPSVFTNYIGSTYVQALIINRNELYGRDELEKLLPIAILFNAKNYSKLTLKDDFTTYSLSAGLFEVFFETIWQKILFKNTDWPFDSKLKLYKILVYLNYITYLGYKLVNVEIANSYNEKSKNYYETLKEKDPTSQNSEFKDVLQEGQKIYDSLIDSLQKNWFSKSYDLTDAEIQLLF